MASTTIRWAFAEHLVARIRTRQVSDGVTASGDATVTSATGAFTSADVGKPISGTGIPADTTIASVTSGTEVEMSATATANGTGVTVTIGAATLVGVQVEPGWPGDAQRAESVWINELDGDLQIAYLKAGRKHRDDEFTIPFEIRVAGKSDLDTTMTRLSEIIAAIEDVFANDPDLNDFDGLDYAEITGERQTAFALVGAGYIGFAEVVVTAKATYE